MSVAAEEIKIRSLLDRVEAIEEVANTLDEGDERREKLLWAARSTLADARVVRPVVAASLLQLSERTVRNWERAGVLRAVEREPRLLLDLCRLHDVMHLVNDLRASGHTRDLLDDLWYRFADQASLNREDLQESVEQMHHGQGRVIHSLAEEGKLD